MRGSNANFIYLTSAHLLHLLLLAAVGKAIDPHQMTAPIIQMETVFFFCELWEIYILLSFLIYL